MNAATLDCFASLPESAPCRSRIHRAVSFDLETFDRLKDLQRALQSQAGQLLTNSDVLRVVILGCRP